MTMLPPPPPNGRHPILLTPLPPPPDRKHSGHDFLEKPSVRPFLLDIQPDEFRSGHLLPKFPPVEGLPKVELESEKPRAWKRHLWHAVDLLAVVAVVALIAVAGRNASGGARAPIILGHSLDPFPNLFPISAPALVAAPIVQPTTPMPAVKKAPAQTPKAVAPKAALPKAPAPQALPKPEPVAPPPPPEDPNFGVQEPGF